MAILYGIREGADVAMRYIEKGETLADAAEESSECQHPEEERQYTKAMGHANRFYCKACKQEVDD